MFRLLSFCIVLIIGYTGCQQPADQEENFCFNPMPGVTYKIDVLRQTEHQWEYDNKQQYQKDSSGTVYSFQLLRKTDTAFLLKLNFESFIRSGTNLRFNTEVKGPSLSEATANYFFLYDYLLHFVKGHFVTVWMNQKGRPVQINGIERLIDSIAIISKVRAVTVKEYLEDYISEDVLKDELNQLFYFLPGKKKSVGQSWVENIILIAKAPVKCSGDFKMTYNKEDTAAIECNSFISARQGGDGRTYMKGKLAGNIVTGYSTGIPYKWHAESETVTTTDVYDITSKQFITATITPVKQ